MRHGRSNKSFSRTSTHRKSMFENMMVSLLRHELIKTTLAKAKELRRYMEPMITMAKEDTLHRRRLAYASLRDKDIVQKLFTEIAPHFKSRPGGYLRVLKYNFRKGDSAPMAVVELVGRKDEEASA
ncbi:MAG TPA: 50S ribosomal protein L17 [Gammaproteobacteria bacterium]|jgi:large subunit ribosomal protein L17|nr:50S ribosomal protein L17 [Gammaproteobacteria bacterium]